MQRMVTLSVLDLSPVVQGSNVSQALKNSAEFARHAERLGYNRFWLAEHHNMQGIASAATSVVIGHVGAATSTIRIGAGGIMLPNHAPLAIAEQFGTLASLFPGRVDLGLGRAPGSDQITARALRRTLVGDVDRFPQDVLELMGYFRPAEPGQALIAVPGAGLEVPIWILGSSLFGAQLAAMLGLPFAFASHFAAEMLEQAIAIYRARFEPSEHLDKPYVMLGINIVAADTDAQARYLATSAQQSRIAMQMGRRGPLPPPVDNIDELFAAAGMQPELTGAGRTMIVGSQRSIEQGLAAFIAKHQPDELIVASQVYDFGARVRSLEVVAAARDALNKVAA